MPFLVTIRRPTLTDEARARTDAIADRHEVPRDLAQMITRDLTTEVTVSAHATRRTTWSAMFPAWPDGMTIARAASIAEHLTAPAIGESARWEAPDETGTIVEVEHVTARELSRRFEITSIDMRDGEDPIEALCRTVNEKIGGGHG